MQAAGFDAPAREDTLTGTRPGELIHAAFELTGFVDRGYQTADLKASGVIGISMRHLDSSTWHLDAASQGVGLVASPRVCRVPFLFSHLLLRFTCISFVFESYHLHFVECCMLHVSVHVGWRYHLQSRWLAECRGRHDDLQLADQVLYGSIAGDAQRRKRGRSLLLRVVVSWRR